MYEMSWKMIKTLIWDIYNNIDQFSLKTNLETPMFSDPHLGESQLGLVKISMDKRDSGSHLKKVMLSV